MDNTTNTTGEALDLNKLAAIADRVEARGLFNAACDIRDWIQEVHAALARVSSAAPAAPTSELTAYLVESFGIGYYHAESHAAIIARKLAAPTAAQKEGTTEQDAKDAARYRFLRDTAQNVYDECPVVFAADYPALPEWDDMLNGAILDKAIDAAIAAQPKDTTKGQA